MDRNEFAQQMLRTISEEEYDDVGHKITAVGLAMSACGFSPSDDEWRKMLLDSGVNIYDSEVVDECIRRTNLLHYSGILRLSSESSWLNAGSAEAFSMAVDDDAREESSLLCQQAQVFKRQIDAIDAL